MPRAPAGSLSILRASFPDQVTEVGLLAAGGAEYVYCERCAQLVPYDSAAICILEPLQVALIYVPPSFTARYPDVRLALDRAFAPTAGDAGDIRRELLHDPREFRRRISRGIAGLALGTINDFTTVDGGSPHELQAWMHENGARLDRGFFAAAHLLVQGSLAVSLGATELTPASSPAGGAAVPPQAPLPSLAADTVFEALRTKLEKLVLYRLVQLAHDAGNARRVGGLWADVRATFVPQVIGRQMVEQFGDVAAKMEASADVVPPVKYAYDATLAAMCHLAGHENPRAEHWVAWFTTIEIARSSGEPVPEGLIPSAEFATATIDVRRLWNNFGGRANRTRLEDFPALNTAFAQMATKLGADDQWVEYVTERLRLNVEQGAPLDTMLQSDLPWDEPARLRMFLRWIFDNLASSDLQRLQAYARAIVDQALQRGHASVAAWAVARVNERLNERSLAATAMGWLREQMTGLRNAGAWDALGVADRVMLLTEEGNTLRYVGSLPGALQRYQEIRGLLARDLSDSDVRTNERNLAIVLRDLGRVDEALPLLESLLPHASHHERVGIQHSLAVCSILLRDNASALEMLRDAVSAFGDASADAAIPVEILLSLASVADTMHLPEVSFEAARRAEAAARLQGNFFGQALASGMASAAADDLDQAPDTRRELANVAVDLLTRAIAAPAEAAGAVQIQLHACHLLADRLEALGEYEEAARVLEAAVRDHGDADIHQAWAFWVRLSHLARASGDVDLARTHLVAAQRAVLRMADAAAVSADTIALMKGKEHLQQQLADDFLEAYEEGAASAADLRLVADFQASVLLSRRLAASTLVRGGDAVADDAAMRRLATGADRLAVVQAFASGRRCHLLLTDVAPDGVRTGLLEWSEPLEAIVPLIGEAWNRLAKCSPARRSDPLEEFEAWTPVRSRIAEAVGRAVPAGTHLCIVPGILSGLPLQYALAPRYPLSFAPSVAAACALHERRLGLEHGGHPGGGWRPASVHDFVVWQVAESPESIRVFREAADRLQEEATRRGVEYRRALGRESTREALFEALRERDCVRLSCHGRSRPSAQRFELLVAADDQLPPRDATALDGAGAAKFLVGWQDFSSLATCAPLVFSAACGSGLALTVEGGERIGLERPLLRCGTHAFVAPQWPVPIASIQPLVHRIIAAYLADRSRSLAQVVFAEANAAIAEGMPLRVARSVAVHGDWL